MRRVHSLYPAPPGLFLYFGSELGGGDGASDPSTDSRAPCRKKSVGEWRVGGSGLGCAPRGHLPALHTRMSTRVSHHSFISSSLTRCHIPPPSCKPAMRGCRVWAKGKGAERRGRRGLHPNLHTRGHMHRAGVSLELQYLLWRWSWVCTPLWGSWVLPQGKGPSSSRPEASHRSALV